MALRAVMQVNSRFSATELHETLNVEWLDVYRKWYTYAEVYKLVQGLGPPNPVNLFEPIISTRFLRSNDKVKLGKPRTKSIFASTDFVVQGMTYWDFLPPDIQSAPSIECFKQRLKNAHVFKHIT